MKTERQKRIIDIIEGEIIETQEQLIARLADFGIESTQATISRDIKQLHLIKEPAGGGHYRYAVSEHKSKLNIADRLQAILRESIIDADYAGNMAVIKTMPGLAGAAGAAFDGMNIPTMVGCISGDDTVFVVMRDEMSAADLCIEIRGMKK
ncbi:MAG: arginine repressor [Oscillospiraceae bacterium]|jgi:transcriptional regulator of arginine metabolism|nr:arginine repressor [Oscillospiraceae bacterium]MBQ5738995.1 arginine repressor [Oscillospiraceae bacterium]